MAIQGINRVRAQLRKLPADLHRGLVQAVSASAAGIEQTMKTLILRDRKTGRAYRRGAITKRSTKALRALGLRAVAGAKPRVQTGSRFHRASAPGEPPASDTGNLVRNIGVIFADQGLTARVGVLSLSRVPYARALEFGTRRMRPRPFIRPTYMFEKANVQRRLKEAVETALRKGA